jgi:endogenous inhibitor of DNA gyrase (YacG/DUF329 family)
MMMKTFTWLLIPLCLFVLQAQERGKPDNDTPPPKEAKPHLVKKCPQCSYVEKREDATFCIHCGTKLVTSKVVAILTCPECNRPLDKGGKFCPFCGQKGQTTYLPSDDGYEPKPVEPENPLGEHSPDKTSQPETKAASEVATLPLQQLLYPGSSLVEERIIEEGLAHTSQQRTILRKLYSCPGSLDEVEMFYRHNYPKIAVIKASYYDILRMLQLKVEVNKQQVEILLCTSIPTNSSATWATKQKQIKMRLDEEMKPLVAIDKEIAMLENLCKEGKVTAGEVEGRIIELKRRKNVSANSSTFWNITVMDRVMNLKQNVLLLTTVNKK